MKYREAEIFEQAGGIKAGRKRTKKLGEKWVKGKMDPVVSVRRATAGSNPAQSPEEIVPESKYEAAIEKANENYIKTIERRSGKMIKPQLILDRLKDENKEYINDISHRATDRQIKLLGETNSSTDLERLIRLNQRLARLVFMSEILNISDEKQFGEKDTDTDTEEAILDPDAESANFELLFLKPKLDSMLLLLEDEKNRLDEIKDLGFNPYEEISKLRKFRNTILDPLIDIAEGKLKKQLKKVKKRLNKMITEYFPKAKEYRKEKKENKPFVKEQKKIIKSLEKEIKALDKLITKKEKTGSKGKKEKDEPQGYSHNRMGIKIPKIKVTGKLEHLYSKSAMKSFLVEKKPSEAVS